MDSLTGNSVEKRMDEQHLDSEQPADAKPAKARRPHTQETRDKIAATNRVRMTEWWAARKAKEDK
jgi:hypothetical protein